MKAIAIRGVAALVSTAEEALRPARDWLAFIPWRNKAAAPPTKEPPEKTVGDPSVLDPTLYRFILRHSLGAQIFLLVLTLVSFPFLYYSLKLPREITDGAIKSGKHFPVHILGFELDQISYLMELEPQNVHWKMFAAFDRAVGNLPGKLERIVKKGERDERQHEEENLRP